MNQEHRDRLWSAMRVHEQISPAKTSGEVNRTPTIFDPIPSMSSSEEASLRFQASPKQQFCSAITPVEAPQQKQTGSFDKSPQIPIRQWCVEPEHDGARRVDLVGNSTHGPSWEVKKAPNRQTMKQYPDIVEDEPAPEFIINVPADDSTCGVSTLHSFESLTDAILKNEKQRQKELTSYERVSVYQRLIRNRDLCRLSAEQNQAPSSPARTPPAAGTRSNRPDPTLNTATQVTPIASSVYETNSRCSMETDLQTVPEGEEFPKVTSPPVESARRSTDSGSIDGISDTSSGKLKTIELTPGVNMKIRGKTETWKAVKEGNVTVTKCVKCEHELYCIADAKLVACPYCIDLSPVIYSEFGETDEERNARFGVGVGLKMETVARWYSTSQWMEI